MALSLQQTLRQTQRLIMTPQMQQSIQLLQLNSMELEQMIHNEMLENPFLEMTDDEESLKSEPAEVDVEEVGGIEDGVDLSGGGLSEEAGGELAANEDWSVEGRLERDASSREWEVDGASPDLPPEAALEDSLPKSMEDDFQAFDQNDVDWSEQYNDSDTISYSSGTHEDHEEHDFTTYTALGESLYDSLSRQLRLSVLEGREFEIGEYIVGNLDSNGFLDCSVESIAMIVGYPPDLVNPRGDSTSDNRLRRMLRKVRPDIGEETTRQLSRKQLIASVSGAVLRVPAEETMAMAHREMLTHLVGRRLHMSAEEVVKTPNAELILDAIALRMKTDRQVVFDVLEVIQDFEPTGVGARDLKECLRLQCEEKGIRNRLLYLVLDEYLADLQQKRFREISKAIGVTEEDVQQVFHIVEKLDPRPGQSQTKDTARYITPDVFVKKIDEKYMYFLNEGDAGRLRIASNYRRLIQHRARRGALAAQQRALAGEAAASKNGASINGTSDSLGGGSTVVDTDTGDYAHEKYKNAVWLIKNIEKRKSTVLRVTEAIMNYQKDFLEKGIEYLHPLTLRNIAEVVGMHESTIARVTTGKYVETPRGIFELKFFFSSGLETESGEDASSRSIKEVITQMIGKEEARKPLSDQKIADMLKDRGIQIARRTVAKYREQLKILPAKLRKTVK
jgi:RNA polymerase sigma-54 factor